MRTFSLLFIGILLHACVSDKDASNVPEIDSAYFRSDFKEGEMFFDLKENIERAEGITDAKTGMQFVGSGSDCRAGSARRTQGCSALQTSSKAPVISSLISA